MNPNEPLAEPRGRLVPAGESPRDANESLVPPGEPTFNANESFVPPGEELVPV